MWEEERRWYDSTTRICSALEFELVMSLFSPMELDVWNLMLVPKLVQWSLLSVQGSLKEQLMVDS
jgi:hypothetical protein